MGVRIFFATPERAGSGSTGTRSTPTRRITSSTRSAFMEMSERQEGTATLTTSEEPETQNPSRVRAAFISAPLMLRPVRRFTSLKGKSMMTSTGSSSPEMAGSKTSPPQMSTIILLARSMEGMVRVGSTERSRR